MSLDPYASCPCGSGKKFKWCCQPIHKDIDRAFQQEREEQHETALRIMDEVTTAHPTNPEAWGRKAQLLYQNGRVEDAENALEKAFAINPNYPFGLLLRGLFRYHEDEWPGAVLLFRRAADAYDAEASDALAQVYELITDCELKLSRPVAVRAAMKISLRYRPDNEQMGEALKGYFGEQSRMPLSARREWTLLPPASAVGGERRKAWDQAMASESPRLSELARIFSRLTQEDPSDSAAWFNLGLARAWLGDNAGALEALDKHVELEPDEQQAATAWALGEALRLGYGMEETADYVEHSVMYQIQNMQPIVGLLQQWDQDGKLTRVQVDQEAGLLSGIVLEDVGSVLTGGGGERPRRIASTLVVLGPVLRLRHGNREQLQRVRADLEKQVGSVLSTPREGVTHGNYGDVVSDALVFITGVSDRETAAQRSREYAGRFYEDTWIHRPLKSLNRMPPIEATKSPVLRKKLRGVILFHEECATGGLMGGYDFNRLRQKLDLTTTTAGATGAGAAPTTDLGSMNAEELAALPIDTLADEQLEKAYQSAIKLGAQELAGNFARAIVARPVRPEQPDRSPWYFYLIQRSLREGGADEALGYVDEGERVDCEHNEGRRRNEYEMRRGQVHCKRGDVEEAFRVFESLLQRDPMDQKSRATAAESMLAMRQSARALKFAEDGVAAARKLNDRDSEEHFLELTRAARKQGT